MELTSPAIEHEFHPVFAPPHQYYDCIESCFDCADASWICADACLHEIEREKLHLCITSCLSTAEICAATARALFAKSHFDTDMTVAQLKNCIEICQSCRKECLLYAEDHEHCQICAKCCQQCIDVCSKYVSAFERKIS